MFIFTPYIFPFVISDITILLLAIYGWRRRTLPVARLFTFTMACLLIWITTAILAYLSPTLPGKLFWANLAFIGIAYLSVIWLLVVIEYTGHNQPWVRFKSWFFVVPTLVNLAIWTNPWHHWWRGVSTLDIGSGPISLVNYDYQFFFYVIHIPYGYILFVLSAFLLVKKWRITSGIYRRQIALLLISTSLPLISDGLYVLNLWPIPNFNPTTIVFSISGILMAVALFQHRFLDLMPVARNTLVENMSDAMLVLDTQNRIVDLNPSMQDLLNVHAKEAIGQAIDRFLPKREKYLAMLRDITLTSGELVFEQNGTPVYYDLHISPLRNPDGKLTGRLIVLRDMTHRIYLENELRLQNEELKAFTQMVAHDLKAPLGIILGFSELLPAMVVNERDSRIGNYAGIMHNTAQKMSHIIEELLLFAHVRQQAIELQMLDMQLVIAEVKYRLHYAIEEAEATIVYPDSWPAVVGYAPWVEEIWANYLSNGLKYGGQPPHLTLGFTVQENDMIRFWVRDNGSGISAADQARLFNTFTRLDNDQVEGHGLGLSIAKRIADRLGGTVGVESNLGEGSLFFFCLPAFVEELGSSEQ